MSANLQSKVTKISATNHLRVVRFDYEITFDNFNDRKCIFDTNQFTLPGIQNGPCMRIRLNPLHEVYNPNGANFRKPSICLILTHLSASTQLYFFYKTFIVNQRGEKVMSKENNSTFSEVGKAATLRIFEPADLADSSKGLLPDNKLTIYCEFNCHLDQNTEKITFSSQESTAQLVELNYKQILKDFGKIYADGRFYDATFLFSGGNELKAHKAILVGRSPVFAAMFTHSDTNELQESRVEITDISVEVFEQFLTYLYTGTIPSMEQYADKLLPLSEKYQMDPLKSICEDALCTKLTPKVVSNYLLLADTYNAAKLKNKALEYFQKNVQDSINVLFDNNKAELLLQAFRFLDNQGASGAK